MRRSVHQYRAPTCVHRPNHLPHIFNTARLRSASGRIRRLAQTVLCLFFRCLILLLALRICAQLIGHPPATPEKLVTDPNQSNLPSGNCQRLECPHTKVIDDCLSCLFGERMGHGPRQCEFSCPQAAVNRVSGGHLNTSHFEFPLQDILLHMAIWRPQTVHMGPEGPSGQCHLPLPVASYNPPFRAMFNEMTAVLNFILWHTTLVALDSFLRLSLMLHEYGPAHLTKRETWRKFKSTASLSGNRGISFPCRKTCTFLCIFVPFPLTVCMAVVKRCKHQAVSKQLCGLLTKLPSLRLQRGVRSGRKIHGHLVVSFTVQRSFVMRVRFQPSTFYRAFLRRAACIGKWLSQAVFKPYVFLCHLLLLAGDVETNPGPIQAEQVLNDYRDRFISEIDANAVFRELFHHGVISDGDQKCIAKEDSPRQQNTILHESLVRTCNGEALMTACDIIIAVQGNPKMATLGKDMQRSLESGVFGVGRTQEYMASPTAAGPHIRGHPLETMGHPPWNAGHVEGGGGPDGGAGSEDEKEFQRFSDTLRAHYKAITVVYAPHKQDQVMEFINLALSRFKPKSEAKTLKFVRSMTEGIDKVYKEVRGKVEYDSIMPKVKEHRLVVISGAPGTGKSTLAKKLCQDVSRDMESLGYKLVVKVELRDLVPLVQEPSLFGLEQLMELFESAGQMERVVQRMKATRGADMLLILDGYDELPHELRHSSFLVNLLTDPLKSPLPYSHIILTSRSIVMSEINRHFNSAKKPLVNIEVLGFTSEQIQLFIDQYFQREGNSKLSARLSAKLDALPHIKGLCSIPVVLSIISRVFLLRKDLPRTLTLIYEDFVCETLSSMFPGLQSVLKLPDQDHDFLKLCKIAYDCTKQQKLIFTKSDLLGLENKYSDRQTGCGLLTARPVDKLRFAIAESFYFIHYTVQEFLSAAHIALQEDAAQRAIWDELLGQPHLAQTWRFYCGLTTLQYYDLQNSTIRNIKGFDELLMQSLFEAHNEELLIKLMPSVIGDEVELVPKTSYDSMAFGFCLEKHSSLQYLKVVLPSYGIVTEVKHLLEPCLRHQQLQTLAIYGYDVGPEDWRQVEDIFDRIRNCDGTLKGHFGKVELELPPLRVAVKVLCLQHVQEVVCDNIQGCEEVDPKMLTEMEKALKGNKRLKMLALSENEGVALPKEFCRSILLGTRQMSLSCFYLDINPQTWDCPDDGIVPADTQGSVQHVTLLRVPVNVLPKLWSWFSQVKQLECHHIQSPQEDGVREEGMLDELEHTLAEMDRLEKLVLGMWANLSDSLIIEFGLSVLKTIARNRTIKEFMLYGERDRLLQDILQRLTIDEPSRFEIERYGTFHCICLSASSATRQQFELTEREGTPAPHGHRCATRQQFELTEREGTPAPHGHRSECCSCCTML